MISFLIALVALIAGYFLYGKVVEKIFGPDDRQTPAIQHPDGVDYIVLPTWKIFMIQFLNIAGTGPIFGAIMGAKFGVSSYLWIVLGCIFAGAVHDYISGMLSLRQNGAGLPEIVGTYLGNRTKNIMLIFTVLLLIMVGAVFVSSPAMILSNILGGPSSIFIWCGIIIAYYFLATMLPIDKIIGKIYPIFAFALLFMAISLLGYLIVKHPALPELWDGLDNKNPSAGPIFPCLFITIACGAISGFHATQSPLMARCMKSERQGRPIFYGAMITEGIVALIWATVSAYFFYGGAAADLGASIHTQAPQVVTITARGWLGTYGGILALLGVVAAPITTGDTALRSARLIIAEFIHLEQRTIRKRLYICIPLFAVTMAVLVYNLADEDGFNVIWNYFAWANQTLSVFTLWAVTTYLSKQKKCYWITFIPAMLMTAVCTSFLIISPISLGLSTSIGYPVAIGAVIVSIVWFYTWKSRQTSLTH